MRILNWFKKTKVEKETQQNPFDRLYERAIKMGLFVKKTDKITDSIGYFLDEIERLKNNKEIKNNMENLKIIETEEGKFIIAGTIKAGLFKKIGEGFETEFINVTPNTIEEMEEMCKKDSSLILVYEGTEQNSEEE